MDESLQTNHISIDTVRWHALPIEDVLEKLSCTREGLTGEAVRERLETYGPNRLAPPPPRSPFKRFLLQFHDVLIYVLLGAATITALMADWIDAWVIFGVVFINALIGFVQEGKAEKAVEAIRGILTYEAMVLRDGHKKTISVEDIVPGDVVFLHSGDKVPADLRMFQVKDLQIEEAALTGESVPVEKLTEPTASDASLGDRSSMARAAVLLLPPEFQPNWEGSAPCWQRSRRSRPG